MRSRQTMFFTVLDDIDRMLRDIEASINIRYYRTGLFDNKSIPVYNSIFDTPNVGITFSGDWNRIDNYLIMKKATPISIREVLQRTGETRFAIDQLNNPKSIEVKLGGIFQEKENVLVAGRVGTTSANEDSNELYKLFTTKLKKEFRKVGTFYIGKETEEKLKAGWRLVTNEKLPKEYDLTLS